MTPEQARVMAVLEAAGRPLVVAAIAHQAEVSGPTVRKVLRRLDEQGRLVTDASGWPYTYALPAEEQEQETT